MVTESWFSQASGSLSLLSVTIVIALLLFRAWIRGGLVVRVQHDAEIALLKEQIRLSEAAANALVKLMAETLDGRMSDKDQVITSARAETRGARAETLAARAEIQIQRETNHELMAQQDQLIDTYQTIEGALKAVVDAFTARTTNGDRRPTRRPGTD